MKINAHHSTDFLHHEKPRTRPLLFVASRFDLASTSEPTWSAFPLLAALCKAVPPQINTICYKCGAGISLSVTCAQGKAKGSYP